MFQISLNQLFFHFPHCWRCLLGRRYLVWDILQQTHNSISINTTETCFLWIVNGTVLCRYNRAHVRHTTVIYLNWLLLKILWNECDGGKCLCNNLKKILSMLVLTFSGNSWLNQTIFRLRFLFLLLSSFEIFGST